MRALASAYDRTITALAMTGGTLVLVMVVSIVYAVLVRSFGGQPPQWITTFSEYALLYMTMLAAPWLVRERANVIVDTLVGTLPAALRFWLDRAVFAVCAALCLMLAAYGASLTFDAWQADQYDIRSVAVPAWVFHVIMPFGFTLVAVEFVRQMAVRSPAPARGAGRAGF